MNIKVKYAKSLVKLYAFLGTDNAYVTINIIKNFIN
jgi:hypothetical protein